jgi:O-acetyl-ADP-ribose deacetylase (regulator of RNase III)
MLAAARNGFEVVAIPGMGTGLGGVDPADAARAMVDELRAHRQPKPSTVYLVDIDDEILMCLEEALRLAVG